MKRLLMVVVFLAVLVGAASSVMAGDLEEKLWNAVFEGKADVVQALLDQGANVNAKNNDGNTALISAVLKGNADVVRILLDKGADMKAKNNNGDTALYTAILMGKTDVARALLDKGADVNERDNGGDTALMQAVSMAHLSMPRADIVRILLDRGADVNARDNSGNTVLMQAALRDNADVVRALLNKGADINAKDKYGNTALMQAVGNGRTKAAQILKNAGTYLPPNAAPSPEGFVGVPWGASRTQVIQIMRERGWMRLDGASPSTESFNGVFNGMSSQLSFIFEGESFFQGRGDFLARVPEHNIAFTTQKYEETVKNLTEKYGPPTESRRVNFAGIATWKIVEPSTADEYTIYVHCIGGGFYDTIDGMKEKHSSFSITYTAESLKKRLSKQGI